ncbi:hypothetical protein [Pseudoduganella rhizocola]|uniref:hypothetical protein n=1 Tax=Pseudoduganella rhizocola TaxID=3382643 RepID=UPI0038B5F701
MSSHPGNASATAGAMRPFPRPRRNVVLSMTIDRVLLAALRHPAQAEAMLLAEAVDAPTIFRLLSPSGRRRALKQQPYGRK